MLYRYLAGRLRQLGLQQSDIGRELDLCQTAVSHRFNGRTPWTVDEMYKVLDLIDAAPEELHVYFPRGGLADGAKKIRATKGGRSA